MRVVPKAANDMMNVGRLQGFEVTILSSLRQLCLLMIRAGSVDFYGN